MGDVMNLTFMQTHFLQGNPKGTHMECKANAVMRLFFDPLLLRLKLKLY